MLIKFKSKAAADVLMYEEHAKYILDLLGKDASQGIITAEESGGAVAAIEAEIARQKQLEAANPVNEDDESGNDDGSPQAAPAPVKFATRAYPLLEMLRAAHKGGHSTVWGV